MNIISIFFSIFPHFILINQVTICNSMPVIMIWNLSVQEFNSFFNKKNTHKEIMIFIPNKIWTDWTWYRIIKRKSWVSNGQVVSATTPFTQCCAMKKSSMMLLFHTKICIDYSICIAIFMTTNRCTPILYEFIFQSSFNRFFNRPI